MKCRAVKFIAHVAMLIGMFMLAMMLYTALVSPEPVQGRALEGEELKAFMAIRDKHFHRGEASIIFYEDKKPYFIRDGKKCTFK